MNCEQANQIDLVDYLHMIGNDPKKIKGHDYWYFSPFRDEKEASFKIERNKNVWYDHGIGKGGKLVDFVMELYRYSISEALIKISFSHGQNNLPGSVERPPFHLHENSLLNTSDARETAIKIIAAKQPMQDLRLCRYVMQRGIEKSVADSYCYEVQFTNSGNEKIYTAIGFKNNAGGYELRNQFFKASSSPKYVTYLDNNANNIAVFEGFFDFMSYLSVPKLQEGGLTNFLILNSLSFFERSLLLMEKHQSIHLYLDQDLAGKKFTKLALKRSPTFKDESKLYQGYKDLNEWKMNVGKSLKQNKISQSMRRHF